MESPLLLSVKRHGAACSLSCTVCPSTVKLATRTCGTVFADTVYETDAPPWPLGVATETQSALLLTDHVQSRVVSIDSVPVPPPSGYDDDEARTPNWHFCVEDAVTLVDVCVPVH